MSDVTCTIPLTEPPVVIQMGIGVHGPGVSNYHLKDRWCLHLYTYHARIVVNQVPYDIVPGMAGITPAGIQTTYDFPTSHCVHTYAHFHLPNSHRDGVRIPLIQDLGPRFQELNKSLIEAVGWFPTAPARANARLWDILWQITNNYVGASHEHVAVERARHFIERHLARGIAVPDIAKYAGCSHNHLVRLFQKELKVSVVAYVRRRRAERAAYLLRHSNIPIKIIPRQIGIADVQSLNKILRRELGYSPREVRHGGNPTTQAE